MVRASHSRWSRRYRVWKPLGLLVLAGLTPPEWETSIVDENLGVPDYQALPRPDLVGLTAFTSQAGRAYQLAAQFRDLGVPVIIGGIHASMCREEAGAYVDAVVTGEAEGVWGAWLRSAMTPSYVGLRWPRRTPAKTAPHTPSAPPVTTASTYAPASSRHMLAWMPPMMTGTPKSRNCAAS